MIELGSKINKVYCFTLNSSKVLQSMVEHVIIIISKDVVINLMKSPNGGHIILGLYFA